MIVQILVVDDEAVNREILARHFRFRGYSVDTAPNGRAAMQKLEGAHDIASGHHHARMNGVELLAHSR